MAKRTPAHPTVTTHPRSLPPEDAAAYIGFTVAALKSWRQRGTGPVYIRVGRSVRYRIADLDAFQARYRVDPARSHDDAA